MRYEITEQLKARLRGLLSLYDRTSVRKELQKQVGCSKRRANEIIAQLLGDLKPDTSYAEQADKPVINVCVEGETKEYKSFPFSTDYKETIPAPEKAGRISQADTKEEASWQSALEFKEKYVYNCESDQYVFPSFRVKSGNIVLAGDTVRGIQRDYSGLDGKPQTITEVSRKYRIPRLILTDVLAKLGLTHDSLPVTDEELKSQDKETLLASQLDYQRFNFYQDLEKARWKRTQDDASKWQAFQAGTLDPFEQALKSWVPPEHKAVEFTNAGHPLAVATKVFVAGAFDWHIGGRAEGRYTSNGRDWNLQEGYAAVGKYVAALARKVRKQAGEYEKAVILLGGDLYNSLTGFTSNGTPLNNEVGRDTQFDAVLECLLYFINSALELFPNVEVQFVRGNHGGTTDYALGKVLETYYRAEPRLKFNLYSTRHAIFRIKDVLVIMEHGASDQTKHLVPRDGAGRETYVQNILLNNPEKLVGAKQKIFVMGDLHHYVQKDHGSFEFFQFGALPVGDQYSDAKGLSSRPRQNYLVIDETGVSEVGHVYVD